MNGHAPANLMIGQPSVEEAIDPLSDVLAFQRKMGHAFEGPGVQLGSVEMRRFRVGFMLEELRETAAALGVTLEAKIVHVVPTEDLVAEGAEAVVKRLADALDGLGDLDYVVLGTLNLLGLAPVYGEAWRRIHGANMKKEMIDNPTDGAKAVIKPPGWKSPDHRDLIRGLIAS